jgi:hypothetical protein
MALPNGSGGYQFTDGNLNEIVMGTQAAPIAKTAAATLTTADLANGIITYNGAVANLTTPTGVEIDAAFSSMKVNSCFDIFINNIGSTNTVTLAGGTGVTLNGVGTVVAGAACNFRARKSGDGTYVFNRIAG